MKINTDGVLLGAIADADKPATILDIGTGTGVIALMLAQRFASATIDAVEIDLAAAATAERNFESSPFATCLQVYPIDFETYFHQFPERKYDLIISNPPFYIGSLKSPGVKKTLAKHTDIDFFERLVKNVGAHLTPNGCCWLILPLMLKEEMATLFADFGMQVQKMIKVSSYDHSAAHRIIIRFGFDRESSEVINFTIYEAVDVYSKNYRELLQPYFLAF